MNFTKVRAIRVEGMLVATNHNHLKVLVLRLQVSHGEQVSFGLLFLTFYSLKDDGLVGSLIGLLLRLLNDLVLNDKGNLIGSMNSIRALGDLLTFR